MVAYTEYIKKQKPGFRLLLKQGDQGSTMLWVSQQPPIATVGNNAGLIQYNAESGLVSLRVPAVSFADHPALELVTTTGAGDTYTSAFAVALSEVMLQSGLTLAATLD